MTLDSVVGLVFSVFNRRVLKLLMRFKVEGDDPMVHTIDRYLERQELICITTEHPLVGHTQGLTSTLWFSEPGWCLSRPVDNVQMFSMISESQKRLQQKIRFFLESLAEVIRD